MELIKKLLLFVFTVKQIMPQLSKSTFYFLFLQFIKPMEVKKKYIYIKYTTKLQLNFSIYQFLSYQ